MLNRLKHRTIQSFKITTFGTRFSLNMIRSLLYFFAILQLASVSAQDEISLPLEPKGAVPRWLQTQSNYVFQHENIALSLASNKSSAAGRQLYLDQLIQSGKILFGDELSAFCNDQFQLLKSHFPNRFPQSEALVIQSTHARVLFTDQYVLVSNALLAQLDDPYSLFFSFLQGGALYHLQAKYPKKHYLKPFTADDVFERLTTYNTKQTLQADSIASQLYTQCGFNPEAMYESLAATVFEELPYADRPISTRYFASELMYVPPTFLRYDAKFGQASAAAKLADTLFNLRLELIKKSESSAERPLNWRADGFRFERVQELARQQLAYDLILNDHPERALYTLFLLEKDYGQQEALSRLKAHAYLGLVAKEFNRSTNQIKVPFHTIKAPESQRFYTAIMRLNGFGLGAFALRLTTDIKAKNPSLTLEIDAIQQNIIDLLAKTKRFPIDQFSKYSIAEINKINAQSGNSSDKYDKILAEERESLSAVDSVNFLLYAISDWVNQADFVDRMREGKVTSGLKPTALQLNSACIAHFKKKRINEKKSVRRTQEFQSLLEQESSKSGIASISSDSIQSDLAAYCYRRVLYDAMLQYALLDLNVTQVAVLRKSELQKVSTQNWAHVQFMNNYSIEPKGYHFLGILIVPLPVVIPDLIVGGHTTQFSTLLVDGSTGLIIDNHHSISRNPANVQFNYGKLNQYLKSFE